MSLFRLLALLISLVADFGYLNHRFLRLPETIGILSVTMLCSFATAISGAGFIPTSVVGLMKQNCHTQIP